MQIEQRRILLGDLRSSVERGFSTIAQQKHIEFSVSLSTDAPPSIATDPQRLEQILKNMLSNAFKFTDSGRVELRVHRRARIPTRLRERALPARAAVLAFAVTDTGIGIPAEKQQIIFDAFQQADASTSRAYGGTGLGLTISRELARLLGGEIHLQSEPGAGSTFTLYLPAQPRPEASESVMELPPDSPEHQECQIPSILPDTQITEQSIDELPGKKALLIDDAALRHAWTIARADPPAAAAGRERPRGFSRAGRPPAPAPVRRSRKLAP